MSLGLNLVIEKDKVDWISWNYFYGYYFIWYNNLLQVFIILIFIRCYNSVCFIQYIMGCGASADQGNITVSPQKKKSPIQAVDTEEVKQIKQIKQQKKQVDKSRSTEIQHDPNSQQKGHTSKTVQQTVKETKIEIIKKEPIKESTKEPVYNVNLSKKQTKQPVKEPVKEQSKEPVKVLEKEKESAKAQELKKQQIKQSTKQSAKDTIPEKKSQIHKLLPDIVRIDFTIKQQKLLPGKNSVEKTSTKNEPTINENDCFEGIGVFSLWYQNSAYTDGRYNCNNFKVQSGELAGKQAYRVYPPQNKFKEFLGSQHALCFKLPQAVSYTIYKFEDNSLDVVAEIPQKDVKANNWTLVPPLKISEMTKPVVFVISQSSQKITPFTKLADGVQGAKVFEDPKITIQLVKYQLPAEPPVPEDFSHGPASHQNCYGPNRNLFYICKQTQDCIFWSSHEDKFYLTSINRLTRKFSTVQIKGKTAGYILAAACGNEQQIFYAEVEKGEAPAKNGTRKMNLIKCGFDGSEKKREAISTDAKNLNIYKFDACQIAYNNGTIGLMVSRKMTISNDGLNHQGGYAAIFDASSLKMIKGLGQTSGHSFSHNLIPNTLKKEGFLGIDLGDNYPRGVHHWEFDRNQINFKVLYYFKTLHGKQAKSPAGVAYPQYKQISKNNDKFYKWSNDNKTYSELAAPGIINHPSGNIVIFAGENQSGSLNNAKTGTYNNCSRNIGFVKTSKNLKQNVISDGPEETGGFFTFGGQWSQLKNKGIKWLTNLTNKQNASRVKAVQCGDNVFILFELWSETSYINTQYLIANSNGEPIVKNTVIPFKMRLHKSDDIYWTDNAVVIFNGGKGKILNRFEIRVK